MLVVGAVIRALSFLLLLLPLKYPALLQHSHYVSGVAVDFVVELTVLGLADLGDSLAAVVTLAVLIVILLFLEIGVSLNIRLLHLK